MKRLLRRAYEFLVLFGIDPRKTLRTLRGLPFYFRDLRTLKRQMAGSGTTAFPFGRSFPCLEDKFADGGVAGGHYFHQDLLVARRIHHNRPVRHVDVGSRVDGFVAHVAAFREIEVIDIRPLPDTIPNVRFLQADLMKPLAAGLVESTDSVSCLHAMEHFGLGRYGDPVHSDGHLLGLDNLHRLLKPDGKLYFSVPIGPQRIEFNAHRVFSIASLRQLFEDRYRIDQFSYVDDAGSLHENVPLSDAGTDDNFGCRFGCGIFEMTRVR